MSCSGYFEQPRDKSDWKDRGLLWMAAVPLILLLLLVWPIIIVADKKRSRAQEFVFGYPKTKLVRAIRRPKPLKNKEE